MRLIEHKTKDKGDIGVAFVIADLTKNGIKVALPISDHLPFDLIAISATGELSRLSVKFRCIVRNFIEITTLSSYANKNGNHIKAADKSTFDAVATYCPDTELVYYLTVNDLNNQSRRYIRPGTTAEQFADVQRIWRRV